jgi:hypothetical protein
MAGFYYSRSSDDLINIKNEEIVKWERNPVGKKPRKIEALAKVVCSVIPANPGSGPGQTPESRTT